MKIIGVEEPFITNAVRDAWPAASLEETDGGLGLHFGEIEPAVVQGRQTEGLMTTTTSGVIEPFVDANAAAEFLVITRRRDRIVLPAYIVVPRQRPHVGTARACVSA